MELVSKNEKLKFIVERYDKYFDNVNDKGNAYLTINTFILGGVIAGYYALNNQLHFDLPILLLFLLTIASNFTSVFLTLWAIRPYLNTKKDNHNGSTLFFGDVADYHENQYCKMWEEMDDDKWHVDIRKQVCLLAAGLKKKYNRLVYATWLIAIQLFAVALFGVILLNFKIN